MLHSTPLTPHAQQYGSVGLPVDCDVVVVDERGEPLTRGLTGEVTIRGANVMSGYGSDAGADRAAFAGGACVRVISDASTTTATCISKAESRTSSIAAVRKFLPEKSTRRS